MPSRIVAPAALLLLVAGCLFDDRFPEGARLRCTVDGDCVAPQVCSDVGFCGATRATEAPTLTASGFVPAIGGAGAVFVGSVEASAPVQVAGCVDASDDPLSTSVDAADGAFVARFTVTSGPVPADAPPGLHVVSCRVLTEAAVELDVVVGVARVDPSPPALAGADLPLVVRPGEAFTVRATLDEAVVSAALSDGAATPIAPTGNSFGVLTFTVTAAVEGVLALSLIDVTDEAGNVTPSIALPLIDVDGTAPQIGGLRIDGPGAVGPARPDVTVRFTPPGDASATVIIDDSDATSSCVTDGPELVCTGQARLDASHVGTAVVRATDQAGNAAAEVVVFEVDVDPPALITTELTLDAPRAAVPNVEVTDATAGATWLLTMTANDVATISSVTTDQGLVFTELSPLPLANFAALVDPASLEGDHRITVVLEDDAGNLASIVLDEVPRIDHTPPSAPAVDTPGAVILERAPTGSPQVSRAAPYQVLRLDAGAAEPGAVVVAFDQPGEARVELARATHEGALHELTLPPDDRVDVWVQQVDRAGLGSPLVRVRDGVFVRTGSSPSGTVFSTRRFIGAPVDPYSVARATQLADSRTLADPDDAPLVVTGDAIATFTLAPIGGPPRVEALITGGAFGPSTGSITTSVSLGRGARTSNVLRPVGGRNFSATFVFDPLREQAVGFGIASDEGIPLFECPLLKVDPAGLDLVEDDTFGFRGRSQHAMAWDETRDGLLVYGGRDAFGDELDTFVLLLNEAGASPVGGPLELPGVIELGLLDAAIAADPTSGRALVVGGMTTGIEDNPCTFVLDDDTWTCIDTSTVLPSGLVSPGLAYDPQRGTFVLVSAAREVWAFTGTTWALIDDGAGEPPFFGPLMVDRERGTLLDQDMRELQSDGTWRATTPALVGSGPPNVELIAYDTTRDVLVVYARSAFGSNRQTWELDDTGWRLIQLNSAPGSRGLGARMVFDAARGEMLMFGGGPFQSPHQLWRYTGADWELLSPATFVPLDAAAAAFDEDNGVVWFFGGTDGGDVNLMSAWDGTDFVTLEVQAVWPGERTGAAMAWDEVGGRVVLVGGNSASLGDLSDAWAFDGAVFSPLEGAVARVRGALVQLAEGGPLLALGGTQTFDDGNGGSTSAIAPAQRLDGDRFVAHAEPPNTPQRIGALAVRADAVFMRAWGAAALAVEPQGLVVGRDAIGDAPALVARIEDDEIALPAGAVRTGASAWARAAATGFDGETSRDGVRLDVWTRQGWRTLHALDAPASAPVELSGEADVGATPERLRFAVRPQGGNGAREAQVALHAFEARVEYRLPAE